MHRDLRVVGAGLDDQVAVAAGRVELVAREVGEPDEAGREPLGEAESVAGGARPGPTNSDRPNPIVIVRPAGGRSSASPVSSGGASAGPPVAPSGPAASPAMSRADIVVQRRSRSTSSARDVVVRSNAAVYMRSCAGVTIPAWCAPANGYVRLPAAAASEAAVDGRAGQQLPDVDRADRREPAEPDRGRAARRHAEERPARDVAARRGRRLGAGGARLGVGHRVLGHAAAQPAPVTVVVSLDSGSPTASTAAASAWTSAGASARRTA